MTFQYQNIRKAEHGGIIGSPSACKPDFILDFSVNLNPCPPVLDSHLIAEKISRYPDDEYSTLKSIIARHHNRKPEEICVGNGSVEIIRTLCHTLLHPGTTVHIPPHTFSEYALSARLAGAEITNDRSGTPALSFICNPDNPSGILTPRKKVAETLYQTAEDGGILCVDEAFIDLADPAQSVSDLVNPSLFIMRSLTKSFSMAGIRFGYGIGDPELVSSMEVMRPPWTVNALAESMAIQAFQRYNELEYARTYIKKERERIQSHAIDLGLSPSDASANYLLLDTGNDVSDLVSELYRYGIYVRDCHSFGLPSSIRVAVKRRKENTILLEALEECLR